MDFQPVYKEVMYKAEVCKYQCMKETNRTQLVVRFPEPYQNGGFAFWVGELKFAPSVCKDRFIL